VRKQNKIIRIIIIIRRRINYGTGVAGNDSMSFPISFKEQLKSWREHRIEKNASKKKNNGSTVF